LDYRDRVGSPVFTRGPTVRDRHRAAQRKIKGFTRWRTCTGKFDKQ